MNIQQHTWPTNTTCTFVIGEGMKFNFTVALGGVVKNTHDRSVQVVIDDALLTDDLSGFSEKATAPFTALDGLLGRAPFGNLSQSYVSKEVAAQNLEKLTPLPADCYTTSSMDNLFIPKGRHTTTVTISYRQDSHERGGFETILCTGL